MKILLACDVFQQLPEDPAQASQEIVSLEDLNRLIALKGHEITLLYVKEELPSYESVSATQGEFSDDLNKLLEDRAQNVLGALAARLQAHGATCKIQLASGSVALTIQEIAQDLKVDLVIVTRRHTPGIFNLGSVSQAVSRHNRSNTLVLQMAAQTKSQPSSDKALVIGLDGSQHCHQAVTRVICGHAGLPRDTPIYLVHSVQISPVMAALTPLAFSTQLTENLLMEGEVHLTQAKTTLSEAGFTNIEIVLKQGDAAQNIMDIANEKSARLIILGAQGKGAVKHILLGHVADRVVSHAEQAVLLAR